ncbi:unnamed protein product, partial [Ectocarpus sp. 8 AP-2014]
GIQRPVAECPCDESCLAVFKLASTHAEKNIVLHAQSAHGMTKAQAKAALEAYVCDCDECGEKKVSPRTWLSHRQRSNIPTPQVQARLDAAASFAAALECMNAAFPDVHKDVGGQPSAALAARFLVALKGMSDAAPAIRHALGLEQAPDVLLDHARVSYAFVKSEEGEWGIRFACRRSCPRYLGDDSGSGMTKGETFKTHHQTSRDCRPPGVDSSNFQVCVHPGCAPAKGGHERFTAQGLEKHLRSGKAHPGGIGGMVEFLLDPARAKPEGTLA